MARIRAGHGPHDPRPRPAEPARLADKLRAIADREQAFFRDLRRAA
jgi:hypothetical protein